MIPGARNGANAARTPVERDIDVVSQAERALQSVSEGGPLVDFSALVPLLIAIYDSGMPTASLDTRQRAAACVAKMASLDDTVLASIIENARMYARVQQIDDAFPYSPNSFEVLAIVRPVKEETISFLRWIVEHEPGIPRYASIRTLSALHDDAADMILQDIVNGRYPSESRSFEIDLVRSSRTRNLGDV
jgi:hypothetical protein